MQLVNMYTNVIDDTRDRIAIPGLYKNILLFPTSHQIVKKAFV